MKKAKSKKQKKKNTSTSKGNGHSDYYSEKRLPKKKVDPEEDVSDILGSDADDAELGEEHPFKKYPPPKKDRAFREKWRELIHTVVKRDNFKEAHLFQLGILCDLFVEYDDLSKFLRENGYTYEAYGRQGKAIKPFPQVGQINKVKTEIRNYSRMLGLLLSKDKDTGGGGGSGDEDWN